MIKKIVTTIAAGAVSLMLVGSAFAASNPNTTGQPNASCEEETAAPNGFSTAGFANAQNMYAGSGASTGATDNQHAVSQYDVACYQVSQ